MLQGTGWNVWSNASPLCNSETVGLCALPLLTRYETARRNVWGRNPLQKIPNKKLWVLKVKPWNTQWNQTQKREVLIPWIPIRIFHNDTFRKSRCINGEQTNQSWSIAVGGKTPLQSPKLPFPSKPWLSPCLQYRRTAVLWFHNQHLFWCSDHQFKSTLRLPDDLHQYYILLLSATSTAMLRGYGNTRKAVQDAFCRRMERS